MSNIKSRLIGFSPKAPCRKGDMRVKQATRVTGKAGYHHGDLRQQLVKATRELIEEKGAEAFSVSEACRRAGVSTAAPYRHFGDKTDMVAAVILEGMAEMTARLHAAAALFPHGSIEGIAASGAEYVAYAETHPTLFRLMFAENSGRADVEEAGHTCYSGLLMQVAAYLGKDAVDEEVLTVSFPLWTFVHGLSFLRIDGKAEFARMHMPVADLVSDATRRLLTGR
ncbi:transcriptional regulator [Dinoroseobacter shibae DFL 12 = DSM 16493]|uniref:Transcriptional regulator n=1 Tax=Dinoroseobacter shibae (strain DSM 16493 / NCIMB 14021 / DFL 12) TaxID=398580 RepID=A8LLJ1_DINSH|nr:transcriptional regulator [Dinoroseobacter shibae DFL 12 = DSM 16493]